MSIIRNSQNGVAAHHRPLTAESLREWVRAAQPNARKVYGHGPNASQSCGAELFECVQALTVAGYVTAHRMKLAGEPVQIVQRTHRPVLKGARL